MSVINAVLVLGAIATLCGLVLTLSARALPRDSDTLVEQINSLLPQTQCAQCGFPGCRPYAEAIAMQETDINRCPPGGQRTIDELARLLNRPTLPLAEGLEQPPAALAVIDESRCIGCARCLPACPVDAIIGAHQWMHTVVADLCTGCELCIEPCPVDCISMVENTEPKT
ncbi:MAG: electron transport complex subunit RsxB [Pseudomonadota bacterium]